VRILLLGASGFIGRELFAHLAARGHDVVPAVRRAGRAPPFAGATPLVIDLNAASDPAAWQRRLAGFDAVVNCAGILQGTRRQSMAAIHSEAPRALFAGCEAAGVRRVVQVSAISAERAAGTAYALTKLAGEDALRATALEWVVLRPSLVVGRGAEGGTALFRALAALPFAIPVPGDGRQVFQPIAMDDLAAVVAKALEGNTLVRKSLDPVGPERVELRSMLADYRRWMGLAAVPVVEMPLWVVRLAARLGDWLGGPINRTAAAQLEHGNAGDSAAFIAASGIEPQGWRALLAAHPAHAQDRWHARLYFVRPLLRGALALLWIASAVVGALAIDRWAPRVADAAHMSVGLAGLILACACAVDGAIGALLLQRWRPAVLAMVQLTVIASYTLVMSALEPALWADPFGALLKNLPIAAAVLVLGALDEER
jgi:uncharacterized protein YbjT (DUF2867 family)